MTKQASMLFCSLLIISGCEKVVQLDLANSASQWVLEANLDAGSGTCELLISKTSGFYDNNDFKGVSHVKASLESGNRQFDLSEAAAGRYKATGIVTQPGEVWRLRVIMPDQQEMLSETVVVPAPVPLDDIWVTPNEIPGQAETAEKYSLTAKWRDPSGMDNYYRLKISRNGGFQSGLYILADDRLGDGLPISRPVIRQMFEKGDTLHCSLLAVDKAYHRYFTELANSESKGLSSPAPFNPAGNWGGAALGYFGIWYAAEKSLVIP